MVRVYLLFAIALLGATNPKKQEEWRYYGYRDVIAHGIYENNLKHNHNFYWRVTAANVTEIRNGTKIFRVKAKETTCPVWRSTWVSLVYSKICPINYNGYTFRCIVHYRPGKDSIEKNKTECEVRQRKQGK